MFTQNHSFGLKNVVNFLLVFAERDYFEAPLFYALGSMEIIPGLSA